MQYIDGRIPEGLAWPAWSIALVLGLLAIVLLLLGLSRRNPHLLIPHLLMQVHPSPSPRTSQLLFTFTMFVLSVFCVYSLVAGTSLSIRLAVMADESEVLESYGGRRPPGALKLKGATDFVVAIVSVMAAGYFLTALFNVSPFRPSTERIGNRCLAKHLQERS